MKTKNKTRKKIITLDKFLVTFFRKPAVRKTMFYLGGFLVFIAAAFFSFTLAFNNKVLPRTLIGKTDFGGKSRSEAESTLKEVISKNGAGKLVYTREGKDYSIETSEFEVNYSNSEQQTLDSLLGVGRKGSPKTILKETLKSIFNSNKVYASYSINETKLNDYLNNLSKTIDIPEKDATLEFTGSDLKVVPEQIGQKFDQDTNRKIISQFLGNFAFGTLPLEVVKVNPKINSQMAQAAIPETKTLIAHETTFKAGDKTYEIKSADIIGMIDFVATPHLTGYELKPQITSEKVKPFVEKIASEVNHDPKDAKFQVQGGKVSTFQISEKGYKLDSAKATRQIVDALQNGSDTEIVLNVEEVNPEINSDDPSQSGITELIGEGKTSWRGSPANRIHNLTLGSQKLSGIIVKPGQEFSTIKNLAPIDAASGFLPELVIKNSNQVAPEIGGGLCQVSTTLFRAVLNSGLKITARSPHSFRVSYYEPPVGMDATIYDPAPDFKFVNNYSTSILVWAIPGNNSLDFQIYGTKDGRKIDISDPVVGDYVSAGADVYSESASMGAGDIRQVERATPGATASFNYKVTATDGTVLQDETYISKYVAIANSFLYGPGTTGIPGQEVQGAATAAPTPAPEPTAIPKK